MKELELPSNWVAVSKLVDAARFEDELIREVPIGHVLYGVQARAIARHARMDDVLYVLKDGTYAEVHLTWSIETDPFWPCTEFIELIDEWRVRWNDVYARNIPRR